jgi:hypothetical protein
MTPAERAKMSFSDLRKIMYNGDDYKEVGRVLNIDEEDIDEEEISEYDPETRTMVPVSAEDKESDFFR